MQWIDVTKPLNKDTICWPGEPLFSLRSNTSGNCTVSEFTSGCHCGTHMDAPRHFIPNGQLVSDIDINRLTGTCQVIEIEDCCVLPKHLNTVYRNAVFFKTMQSSPVSFVEDYCYISEEAAQVLVDLNVQVVGTDCMSVEKFSNNSFKTHEILLSNGTIIIENINFCRINGGHYEFIAMPLLIDSEASPIRMLVKRLA